MNTRITSSEAAGIIGCNDSRVRQLCRAGTLVCERFGRDWLVDRKSAESYGKNKPKPGRKPAKKA